MEKTKGLGHGTARNCNRVSETKASKDQKDNSAKW